MHTFVKRSWEKFEVLMMWYVFEYFDSPMNLLETVQWIFFANVTYFFDGRSARS